MNKLVSLVNEWDEFDRKHPNSEIDDFCRYFLLKGESDQTSDDCLADFGILLKLASNLIHIFDTLFKIAMSNTALPFPSAFFFLNRIKSQGEIRKTELIKEMKVEYSTGMEYIAKLLKAKLINERMDSSDKRARLLVITKDGLELLETCYPYMEKVGILMFGKANPVNMKVCIAFLRNIIRITEPISHDEKSKDFNTLFELHKH